MLLLVEVPNIVWVAGRCWGRWDLANVLIGLRMRLCNKSFWSVLSENLVESHADAFTQLEIQLTSEIIDRELLGPPVDWYSAVFVFYLSVCTRITKSLGCTLKPKASGVLYRRIS